jgi:hypothetical protein
MMSMLDSSPAAFTAELQSHCRAAANRFTILVVEGYTDRMSLLPFLDSSTQVVTANGKDKLLHAYSGVETFLRDRLVFVLDCDGNTEPALKGQVDLVLTANRDIDADLLYEFGGSARLAYEYYSAVSLNRAVAESQMVATIAASSRVSSTIGAIMTAARARGLRVRVRERGKERPFSPRDVGNLIVHSFNHSTGSSAIARSAASALDWPEDDVDTLVEEALVNIRQLCQLHKSSACEPCMNRRLANGHTLVDSVALGISQRAGVSTGSLDVSRVLRASTTPNPRWVVLERLRAWEGASGAPVLA